MPRRHGNLPFKCFRLHPGVGGPSKHRANTQNLEHVTLEPNVVSVGDCCAVFAVFAVFGLAGVD
eukprot:11162769-Lingulodinium_polyedra.AAC.1